MCAVSFTATTTGPRNDGIYVIGNVTSLDIPYTVSGAVLTQDAHSVANDAATFSPLLFQARFGRGRAAGVASSAIVAGCCVPGFDDDGEGAFDPNANPKKCVVQHVVRGRPCKSTVSCQHGCKPDASRVFGIQLVGTTCCEVC